MKRESMVFLALFVLVLFTAVWWAKRPDPPVRPLPPEQIKPDHQVYFFTSGRDTAFPAFHEDMRPVRGNEIIKKGERIILVTPDGPGFQ